jgi:hypothetical protein
MGLNSLNAEAKAKMREVQAAIDALERNQAAFNSKAVPYSEMDAENVILKRDLRNIDSHVLKLQMDRDVLAEAQLKMSQRSEELAEKYLADVEKWIGGAITENNYASCKQKLTKTIEWCREIGFQVSNERETQLMSDLKHDYEMKVRKAVEKEEQARIKAQIREEQLREREIERELQTLDRERAAIKAALEKALSIAKESHSEEVEKLKLRLVEAEARNERAIAQAQLTKAGHIYVISNLGAFGEEVFKIGMTRRLEPKDRIAELSDASVPFPFDVHMMISCDNAPQLEKLLHREFHSNRLNKVNVRKEFFRVPLAAIASL